MQSSPSEAWGFIIYLNFKEWNLGFHSSKDQVWFVVTLPRSGTRGFTSHADCTSGPVWQSCQSPINFKEWNLGVSQLQDQVWFLATLLRSGIVPCVSLAARTSYIIAKKWNQGFHKEH